jgi:hypothetical protein
MTATHATSPEPSRTQRPWMRAGRNAFLFLATAVLAGCGIFGAGQVAPLPPGTKDCIGLELAHCQRLLDSVASGRKVEPAAWRIRCIGQCLADRGDVEMTVTWADGTTDTTSMGWVGELVAPPGGGPVPGGPIPTPQVQPTCVRVPRAQCVEQWTSSTQDLTAEQRAQVVDVRVECTTSCTLLEGAGRTTVVLKDGSRIMAFDWQYRSP